MESGILGCDQFNKTGLVPFLSQTEKMAGVLLLVSEFKEDDFDVLNDIVKDDDDIVKENELFEK